MHIFLSDLHSHRERETTVHKWGFSLILNWWGKLSAFFKVRGVYKIVPSIFINRCIRMKHMQLEISGYFCSECFFSGQRGSPREKSLPSIIKAFNGELQHKEVKGGIKNIESIAKLSFDEKLLSYLRASRFDICGES
nr:hypothetical protein CFP56_57351 [Quercus suber]